MSPISPVPLRARVSHCVHLFRLIAGAKARRRLPLSYPYSAATVSSILVVPRLAFKCCCWPAKCGKQTHLQDESGWTVTSGFACAPRELLSQPRNSDGNESDVLVTAGWTVLVLRSREDGCVGIGEELIAPPTRKRNQRVVDVSEFKELL